jgi:sugar-specific transcriptional regulator TrmB
MKPNAKLKPELLQLIGLKEKDYQVYRTLLSLGSAPLRRIAAEASISRGTTYDCIKRLQDLGLVSFVDASRHRYFTAEDPQKLRGIATRREVAIQEARSVIDAALPALKSIAGKQSYRPAVRYYEGKKGIKEILMGVLAETRRTKSKTYRVYSSSGIRDLIASAYPKWNTARKRAKIHCRAIAIGKGGQTHGLDERRWLTKDAEAPTYIFIYGEKIASVGIDDRGELFGVITSGGAIASTQRIIFDALWKSLS